MKKNIISLCTITSMLFMPTLKADQPSELNLVEETTSLMDAQLGTISAASPGSEMTNPPLPQKTQTPKPQTDSYIPPQNTPTAPYETYSTPSQGDARSVPLNPEPGSSDEMRSVPLNPQSNSSTTPLNTIEPATTDSQPTDSTTVAPVQPTDEGTPVGQASNAGAKTARNRAWKNIGLAVGAIAVAIVALILVSKNSGHSK